MKKKTLLITIIIILSVILVWVVITRFYPPNNNNNVNKVASNINADNEISNSKNEGRLGGHTCLSLFRVASETEYKGEAEILKLDFFQSFASGAFFGKIKNYLPEQNKQFAAFINQLMQEQKIMTYLHLRADICLYNQDLLNPENGAGLNYYIEHYYCTNHCQTGKYEMQVDLDSNGNFVGYRTKFSW